MFIEAMTMNKHVSALTLSLLFAACSPIPYTGEKISETTTPTGFNVIQTSTRSIPEIGKLAGQETELTQITATVDAIDKKARLVTLKTQDNRLVTVRAGREVKNFNQLRKGDSLQLDYFEAVEFEIRQPTPEELQAAEVGIELAARAAEGDKPGALVASKRIDILTVESIDRKKELITLRAPEGFVTVKAKYPENLRVVKVGDTVVVKSSELFAVRTEQVG